LKLETPSPLMSLDFQPERVDYLVQVLDTTITLPWYEAEMGGKLKRLTIYDGRDLIKRRIHSLPDYTKLIQALSRRSIPVGSRY
jgi:hypothetical protein